MLPTAPIEKICFVAGKSGGHVIPALTQARKLLAEDSTSNECLFFTTQALLDKKLLDESGITCLQVPLATGSRSPGPWYKLPIFLARFLVDFVKSLFYLRKHKVQKIVSMGGLVSLPVCCAGWILRIPLLLYELNAVPGKAVRCLAPLATTLYVCFKEVVEAPVFKNYHKKIVLTKYPIKYSTSNNTQVRRQLGIDTHAWVVVIIGGSQGSQALNQIMQACLSELAVQLKNSSKSIDLVILHQTGSASQAQLQEFYERNFLPARVESFVDLELWYQAADRVVSRAGSGSLHELAYFNKKSVIIPLEQVADDHQVANAYAMQNKYPHLFRVIRQHDAQQNSKLLITELI